MFSKSYYLKVIVLLLPMMLVDCRCNRRPLVIRMAAVELPFSYQKFTMGLEREKFQALVFLAIKKNPNFYLDLASPTGAEIIFSFAAPNKEQGQSQVLLAAILKFATDNGLNEYKTFTSMDVKEGMLSGSDISWAIERALHNLFQLYSGKSASNQEYLALITEAALSKTVEQGELLNAISVLGDARDRMVIEPLIALLRSTNDLAIGNEAMMALGKLRAEESINAIIEFAERKPPLLRRQAIIAAKQIGNKEALAWLLVMAYGHEDPLVRKEALMAVREIEKKINPGND